MTQHIPSACVHGFPKVLLNVRMSLGERRDYLESKHNVFILTLAQKIIYNTKGA